jgi:hypothetical protein
MGYETPSGIIIVFITISVGLIGMGLFMNSTLDNYGTNTTNISALHQFGEMEDQIKDIQNRTEGTDIESGTVFDTVFSVSRGAYEAIKLTFRVPNVLGTFASNTTSTLHMGTIGTMISLLIELVIGIIITFAIISAAFKWRL